MRPGYCSILIVTFFETPCTVIHTVIITITIIVIVIVISTITVIVIVMQVEEKRKACRLVRLGLFKRPEELPSVIFVILPIGSG